MKKIRFVAAIGIAIFLVACANTGIGTTIENAITARPGNSTTTNPVPPPDLPIPAYEGAQLIAVNAVGQAGATVVWSVPGAAQDILAFYGNYAQQQEWQLLSESLPIVSPLIGFSKEYLIAIVVIPNPPTATQVQLQYTRLATPIEKLPTITSTISPTNTPTNTPTISTTPTPTVPASEVLPSWRDLQQLGILGQSPGDPNAPITRREYARWLVTANNRLFRDRVSAQIRLAVIKQDQPTFADVPSTDPDFMFIQGLANAGLIDRGDQSKKVTKTLFRPNAVLTREIMILWKTPLDTRKSVAPASVSAVQKAWGFQDSKQITPKALGAVLIDARSGELANIRRSFGFTTLLQPQKQVSRAEAAAALWYFGNGEEGVSAENVLAQEKSQQP